MTSTTSKSLFAESVLSALPFVLIVAPFGVLYGVVATASGLDLTQTMVFTTIVFAGAAQFTALQLMTENAPLWLSVAAALAVNLRMAMYSASLQPYFREASFRQRLMVALMLFDQSYAIGISRFEGTAQPLSTSEKFRYFTVAALIIVSSWLAASFFGAVFGATLLPDSLPIDFAMPIMFLAIVGPLLKTPAHLVAAVVSIVVALIFSGLPSGLGLMIAAVAAMVAGAEVERRGFGP